MKPTIMNFRDFMDQMAEVAEGRQAPAKVQNRQNFVAKDIAGQSAINTFVEQQLRDAVSINRSLANSRKETICSRLTLGKPPRKSSIDSPASR